MTRGTHHRLRAPTGVSGLDQITHGGLPRGRATLVVGGPGSGKTVLALQSLVHGAERHGEPGIFVAFEESAERLVANAASFGWDLPRLRRRKLFFLDARPTAEHLQSGNFDLLGLLAALGAKASSMGARRIVFDAVDMVLGRLAEPTAARLELLRLHEWLVERELTAVVTAKSGGGVGGTGLEGLAHEMQFLLDAVLTLDHRVEDGISHRSLRVLKYRGSSFAENEAPFAIGPDGLEMAGIDSPPLAAASTERVSSGVDRLDTMLGGGYLRDSSVLVTGAPGTAKSTLCGAFLAAALRRGERSLYVSFDSEPGEIVRNMASVGIRLEGHRRRGTLRLLAPWAAAGSAELHFLRLSRAAREHGARCVVVDPVSALAKAGNRSTGHSVAERLTRWAKSQGITLVCASLLADGEGAAESTPLEISTLADTWIHLTYQVRAGERNRALTIVKSRGSAHSNQVRELVLSDTGVTLADVFTAGGEVLMGTLRWEKEEAERAEESRRQDEVRRRLDDLAVAEAELEARARAVERELAARRAERERLVGVEAERRASGAERESTVRSRRRGDAPRTSRRG
jgi:circadian clock protein KaiC